MEIRAKAENTVTLKIVLTRDEAMEISEAVCKQRFGQDPILTLLKGIETTIDDAAVRRTNGRVVVKNWQGVNDNEDKG